MTQYDDIIRRPPVVVEHPADGMLVERIVLSQLDALVPLGMSRDTIAPGASTVVDVHAEHEVWCIVGGSDGELSYRGEKYTLKFGDLVYFEPQRVHQLRNCGTKPLVLLSVWWGG